MPMVAGLKRRGSGRERPQTPSTGLNHKKLVSNNDATTRFVPAPPTIDHQEVNMSPSIRSLMLMLVSVPILISNSGAVHAADWFSANECAASGTDDDSVQRSISGFVRNDSTAAIELFCPLDGEVGLADHGAVKVIYIDDSGANGSCRVVSYDISGTSHTATYSDSETSSSDNGFVKYAFIIGVLSAQPNF
jgi:hypothetical protein